MVPLPMHPRPVVNPSSNFSRFASDVVSGRFNYNKEGHLRQAAKLRPKTGKHKTKDR